MFANYVINDFRTPSVSKDTQSHTQVWWCVDIFCRILITITLICSYVIHTQSGEKSYTCEVCNKLFISLTNLTIHKKTVHDGVREFACDQCEKSFIHSYLLEQHKEAIHQGIRSNICKICDKSFSKASGLKRHLLAHSGERPFPCDECDRAFTRASILKVHKDAVHQGVRPFACHLCDKSFTLDFSLKKHLQTHTGSCDETIEIDLMQIFKLFYFTHSYCILQVIGRSVVNCVEKPSPRRLYWNLIKRLFMMESAHIHVRRATKVSQRLRLFVIIRSPIQGTNTLFATSVERHLSNYPVWKCTNRLFTWELKILHAKRVRNVSRMRTVSNHMNLHIPVWNPTLVIHAKSHLLQILIWKNTRGAFINASVRFHVVCVREPFRMHHPSKGTRFRTLERSRILAGRVGLHLID